MSRSNHLQSIITDEISAHGPVPFRRFMELCLYHPEHGYYEQSEAVVGKAGDFYTSVSVGRAFGRLLASEFRRWAAESSDGDFTIVETGAHDATLCRDILLALGTGEAGRDLSYVIIEPSLRRRDWQRETLGDLAGRVRWLDRVEEFPPKSVNGLFFSNELFDAMPIHRLVWNAASRSWREACVGQGEGGLAWCDRELDVGVARKVNRLFFEAEQVPEALAAVLPDGYVLEYSPAAGDWWRKAAERLHQGRLLMFDYGMEVAELLRPERIRGTLRAYSNHRSSADVLANPGEQDLTAHVNLTQLIREGEAAGLVTETLTTQSRFLTGLLSKIDSNELDAEGLRQVKTLIHPDHLGSSFKVLVQRRR